MRANNQGAVLMIPVLRPSGRLVILRQYRPPLDAYVLEFPAGLIDPGESGATTAVRELLEETGYTGELRWIGQPASSSAGGLLRKASRTSASSTLIFLSLMACSTRAF